MGTLWVNVSQIYKFKVTSDNVHLLEKIIRNNYEFFTLDPRPYITELELFGIEYTFNKF